MSDASVTLTVNGTRRTQQHPSGQTLLDCVRDTLGLKGAKLGCQTGDCGACTMLVDGTAVQTCQMAMSSLEGADVTTIEGVTADPLGGQIAAALIAEGAAQCGYCLPGIVTAATGALKRDGQQTDIAAALSGNICRCGTQHRILVALRKVRDALPEDAP